MKTKKIFVGGLKPDTPDEIVRNYFSQYGTVSVINSFNSSFVCICFVFVFKLSSKSQFLFIYFFLLQVIDIDLVKEKETNRRRGFCFVEFDSEDTVDRVLQKQYHDLADGIKVNPCVLYLATLCSLQCTLFII